MNDLIPEYKSKIIVGNIIVYSTKKFNWFRKLMYKAVFDIDIKDLRGEDDGNN